MGLTGSSPRRHSIRLPGYDYSQAGAYFVTIVTQDRSCLFGRVEDSEMELNAVGTMVEKVWLEIPEHFDDVNVDTFVVMPNHLHGIIEIFNEGRLSGVEARHAMPLRKHKDDPVPQRKDIQSQGVGATHESPLPTQGHGPKPESIGVIVGLFKATVSKRYHEMTNTQNIHLWQRNYYEHVIRDERDYQAIYDYILTNPVNWDKDGENQANRPV